MAGNTVVGQIANPLGAAFGSNSVAGQIGQYGTLPGLIQAGVNSLGNVPNQPNTQAPNALSSVPTTADANTTALQNQLSKEKMESSTSTILTGGQGLLDQPSTTSSVLMGN